MINKIYEKIVKFIKENYLYLLTYLIIYVTLTYPLPYYIYTGGGIMNVNDKISLVGKTKSNGSYNLCYVEEIQATIPTYLLSFIKPNWDMVSKDDVTLNTKETSSDIMTRDKIYLDSSNQNAVITAFKYANLDYEILSLNPVVIYILEEAKTNLKIGDEIISIDDIKVSTREDITNIISSKEIGTKVNITVLNNKKEYKREAEIIEKDGNKLLGISSENNISFKTNPEIKFNFKRSESGPSGGFILSLAIYDFLVDEDITKGLKISGTGTIDYDGNVGSIGGVKYKLSGAVKKKSDIFFVPNGENYEEAIKIKNEKKYNIKVVGVSTLEDAINYLKEM